MPEKSRTIQNKAIQHLIYTIRDRQVMLDSDLAELYRVETKVLNQAVKRNIERFPDEFMFRLRDEEWDFLRSQIVTLKKGGDYSNNHDNNSNDKRGRHRKYLPYMFTEQGVAMLSTVLRSDVAIKVSIQIMQAFVNMRKFLLQNASIFQRIDQLEFKQLKTDEKLEQVFKALDAGKPQPDRGIFFDGQIFDAYRFVSDLIRKAQKSIILIDNYIDDSVLSLFTKRRKGVSVIIYTKNISKQLALDLKKHNDQYEPIAIEQFKDSHDRFLFIDSQSVYHIGASLKDLGKKWFAFSKMDVEALDMLNKIKKQK